MARIAVVTVPYFITDYHRRLADDMVCSIRSTHEIDRIAIANHVRSEDDGQWLANHFDHVEHNEQNILARAWNIGIKRALERGASHIIVANLDLIFHPWCIDNLFECAQQNPEKLVWSAVMWHDQDTLPLARIVSTCTPEVNWSCFMVDSRLTEIVGLFDEKFTPAYREDNDMARRMRLLGHQGTICHAAVVATAERGTIKGMLGCEDADIDTCSTLLRDLRLSITRNDDRYLRKWGGEYGAERFTVPFDGGNDPDNP